MYSYDARYDDYILMIISFIIITGEAYMTIVSLIIIARILPLVIVACQGVCQEEMVRGSRVWCSGNLQRHGEYCDNDDQ